MSETINNTERRPLGGMAAAPQQPPILFLHGIDRHYRQGNTMLHILKGAELAVWPGQSIALIAPSGAGKSTLLHVAGLLERPDAGEVYVEQVATSSLSDAERTRIRRTEIGFVYQFHHLLMEFSAIENVIMPQMVRGLSRRARHDAAAAPRPRPRVLARRRRPAGTPDGVRHSAACCKPLRDPSRRHRCRRQRPGGAWC